MVILDANILIYAYHADAAQHAVVSTWLENQTDRFETVGLTWPVIWAFLRICTNERLWMRPPSVEEVFERLEEWQSQPKMVLAEPGPRHLQILKTLSLQSGVRGALVTDAVLAAIAIEHAATLASTDREFRRFSGLRWVNPLEN